MLRNKQLEKEMIILILTNELKGKIVAKGLRQEDVAKSLGISTKTFNSKLNRGIFNSLEIEKLIVVLDIKNPLEIFFANIVTHNAKIHNINEVIK